MEGWDSPKKSRTFLAAALLTAACGIIVCSDDPVPSLDASRGAPPEHGALATPRLPAATSAGSDAALPSDLLFAGETFPVGAELHDAVASLGAASLSQTAARSAAFSGPAGKPAFAAFAAAGSPSAAAARLAGEALRTRPSSRRTPRAAAAPAQPQAPVARSAGQRAAKETAAPGTRAPTARSYDARRFFANESDARGASAARGASRPDEATAASRPAAGRRPSGRKARRWRPALLSSLLGRGALKAPVAVSRPRANPWKQGVPQSTPDGRKITATPLGIAATEAIAPPQSCRKAGPHWHSEAGLDWAHESRRWGRWDGRSWAWLERTSERWWAWPDPARGALLRHQDHWWMKSRGLWFLLHDNEPWGYRFLSEWGRDGFEHSSGAQMIYSADGSRVGIIVPGEGAVLYDSVTGAELGRWSQDQLPRRRPSAPLQLPPLP